MYQKVSTDMNFVAREEEIVKFWRDNEVFKKSVELRKGAPAFTFFDGPPTANGKPHIGHVETRAIKDLIPRYRTMKGFDVLRKAGWDTHGLPVELEVEKLLGLDGKPQIESYGIEPFIKECKKSVWKYKTEWEEMSERVGFWADMEDPYVTYEDNYIESEWWSLKEIHKKGLLYKGHKIVPYCPRCGTALSSHEVAQGYKNVKETSAYVRFAVKGEENTYLLAWTTTPWTLPSNLALCVNPHDTYCKFIVDGQTIIMAKALIDVIYPDKEIQILAEMPGCDLRGLEYVPLFDFAVGKLKKKAWFVVCDEYVTMSDGTGIVHIAPAYGEDDYRVCRDNDVPFVNFVDAQGCMTADTKWPGVFVKDVDALVLEDLKARGLLFAAVPFAHDYPFCWRCDTPLIYYARQSWFIKMTAVRDQLMKNNRAVNWLPENIKEGRMGNFLENVIDWGLSRERYWGTPLPVWTCECGHIHVVGSKQELREMATKEIGEIELHRPYIDEVTLKCPECGGEMQREKEVIDCWYDSGSMPFAQWHYPFENKEKFERRFPANFISEAIDQTRGWFYTLLAISTCLFDTNPFENCVVMGHVQDKDGQKMSKHKGNTVNPWDVLNAQGADAVRWFFYNNAAPWLPKRFHAKAIEESQRKYMGTLWNTYAFFILYAEIDQFDPKAHPIDKVELTLMDKWALSRLNTLIKNVDNHLENYRITEASREMVDFVDDLSNWYVRRSRERFWGKGMAGDKEAAFATLYHILETMARLTAPFTPFMAENMYRNLVCSVDETAPISVHLTDFPVCDENMINPQLEEDMKALLRVVMQGRAARAESGMKVRQPLAKMIVAGATLPQDLCALAADELNVKNVEFTDDTTAFMTYQLKPQMRTLGKKYGKLLKAIGEKLTTLDGNEVVSNFEAGNQLTFELDGNEVVLEKEDVLTSPMKKPGYVVATDRDVTVALDTNLNDALVAEGFAREVVSKLQTMRKEAGFEVTDRILVTVKTGDEKLAAIVTANVESIKNGVLALEVVLGEAAADAYVKDWSINGVPATLSVRKA
ncbi:MAG: isoleucine--tRNA ligase [Clostridiales bacterium]|nr:isoleucine--tRNA ligase [Clostridiales bacterium]